MSSDSPGMNIKAREKAASRMARRELSRTLAVLLVMNVATLGGLSCARSPIVPPDPPTHAILITIDTLRADRLGAYGYDQASTPNLDALAGESIRFERAYSHSSKTFPSISTLLSGRPVAEHGIYNNSGSFPENMPTLATSLEDAGFETAAFIGSYALRPNRGLTRGFDSYTQEYLTTEAVRPHPENRAGALTDEAIAWFSTRNSDHPLFLWIHYQEPHGAYTPPTFRETDRESGGPVLRRNPTNTGRDGIPAYQWLGHGRLDEYQARYDGEITEFDRHLRRLMKALKTTGILERSILVLTGDHGEAFGEEGLYCTHGEGLLDVVLRVPLLVKIPGHQPEVRTDRVRLIDISRTVLETLRLDAFGFQGHSLFQNIGDRTVVAQMDAQGERWRSYRSGVFELRQVSGQRAILHAPPGVSAEDSATVFERLQRNLSASAPWPEAMENEQLSQQERDALKAMGYLD